MAMGIMTIALASPLEASAINVDAIEHFFQIRLIPNQCLQSFIAFLLAIDLPSLVFGPPLNPWFRLATI